MIIFIIIIIFYILKSLYLVFLYWQQSKFSAKLGERISCNLYSNYLYKPYSFHINKNSSELLRNIKIETLQFTEVIKSTLNIFLETLVLMSILILLIYIEPIASISMLLFCVLLSVFFSKFTSKRLERWGQIRQAVSIDTTKTINHSLGAIKDVKIFELENNFLNEFINSNSKDVNIQKTIIDHVMTSSEESECTYYLADRKFLDSSSSALKGMTEKLFGILHRNSATASSYFGLPENRVITLSTQMHL